MLLYYILQIIVVGVPLFIMPLGLKKIEQARNSAENKKNYYVELLGRVLVYTGISLFVVNLVIYLGFINIVVGDTIKNLILFGSCLLFDFFVIIVIYIIIKIIEKKSLK
ncbi:MAG: hypothetical protein GX149_01030 [Acholeplasmataceae bacterium]|jgi:hypothetical protein|nr:hypothetical protein [Acholeplasmataceae bacterium]